jgi:WD40 repeat protein
MASGAHVVESATTSKPPVVIDAHRHPLTHMAMSASGVLLATASESGTVVKVFDLAAGGALVHVLRAQLLSSNIQSIAFNRAGTLLCATFDSTLHVFRLAERAARGQTQTYAEWVSTYLPKLEGVPSAANSPLPGVSSCVFLPEAGSVLAVCFNGSALRFRLMLPDAKLQHSEFHKLHRRDGESDYLKMLDFA